MTKVCIELENGKKMIVTLYEDVAPLSCKNFLELVDKHFYQGIVFHRVIRSFMCQAGGYYIESNQIKEKEKTPTIKGEFESNGIKNDLKHELGVISMARTNDKNSGSSQFFLCVDNCNHLDKEYAGFGKIEDEESLKNLVELNNVPTTMIGGYFQDWPAVETKNYTIKDIYRI